MVALVPFFLCGSPLRPVPRQSYGSFLTVAIFTCIDLACMNMGLDYLSVSVQQALNAATPAAVIFFELVLYGKMRAYYVYLPFIPLLAGSVITTLASGEHQSSPIGILIMVVAIFSGSLKAITTHKYLIKIKNEMGVVSFLFWLDAAMLVMLVPWAHIKGETQGLMNWKYMATPFPWIIVLSNGLIGGLRAYLVKLVLKFNTPLTKVVCDIIIKAMTIGISIIIFGTLVPALMGFGVILTLFGFGMYSVAALREKFLSQEELSTNGKKFQKMETVMIEQGSVYAESRLEKHFRSEDSDERPLLCASPRDA
eukprot:CAMPEP_0185255330 /NCGR_PEP_ID=MMETSP1359-20130426/4347_1 /TAXON_ID=552665 /ORGANISM="Bigelowiella longifila, Strain CCMP242" /LENGTH=309 /DNA_ID=CAMNT_0027839129 /DNA_START=243 /DNA_END=1172 /DNA_ORIENTATION=+